MTQTIIVQRRARPLLRCRVRAENGVLIPDEAIRLPTGESYIATLRLEPAAKVDALAEIAAMARPLGASDLARNFDTYTRRIIADETTA